MDEMNPFRNQNVNFHTSKKISGLRHEVHAHMYAVAVGLLPFQTLKFGRGFLDAALVKMASYSLHTADIA